MGIMAKIPYSAGLIPSTVWSLWALNPKPGKAPKKDRNALIRPARAPRIGESGSEDYGLGVYIRLKGFRV